MQGNCCERLGHQMASQPERALQRQQLQRPVLANFGALPRDALCHISSFLRGRELLGIRCQSKHCRDAIRYAAAKHPGCSCVIFGESRPMEARMKVARAFGHACRQLEWHTVPRTHFTEDYASLHASDNQFLLEWCQSAPRLVRLDAGRFACIDMERAAAIGRACPMLVDVEFCRWYNVSPAESWAKHFPCLRTVLLYGDRNNRYDTGYKEYYTPTDLEAISETVRVCTRAVFLNCQWCDLTRPVLDRIIGTAFGNRLSALNFSGGRVDAELVLACARELPQLRALGLPKNDLGDVSFYEALGLARPELTYLKFHSSYVDDSLIVAAVSRLRLRCLHIEECFQGEVGGSTLVDGILASPSAASLEELIIEDCGPGFGGLNLLRLVNGCPRLHTFDWKDCEYDEDSWYLEPESYRDALQILNGRYEDEESAEDYDSDDSSAGGRRGGQTLASKLENRSNLKSRLACEIFTKYSTPY